MSLMSATWDDPLPPLLLPLLQRQLLLLLLVLLLLLISVSPTAPSLPCTTPWHAAAAATTKPTSLPLLL